MSDCDSTLNKNWVAKCGGIIALLEAIRSRITFVSGVRANHCIGSSRIRRAAMVSSSLGYLHCEQPELTGWMADRLWTFAYASYLFLEYRDFDAHSKGTKFLLC